MKRPRTDMIPVQHGMKFEAIAFAERLPTVCGWYLICTNALPNSCGKLWFDGKEFAINNQAYAYSSLLAQGKELFWLELKLESNEH